jgi:hypothetical protein
MIMIMNYNYFIIIIIQLSLLFFTIIFIIIIVGIIIIHIFTILINNRQTIFSFFQIIKNITHSKKYYSIILPKLPLF